MVAWFALAILLTTNGVEITGSPQLYQTQEECVAANKKVEDSALKVAKVPEGVLAYHFECLPLKQEDFKKPGLDA